MLSEYTPRGGMLHIIIIMVTKDLKWSIIVNYYGQLLWLLKVTTHFQSFCIIYSYKTTGCYYAFQNYSWTHCFSSSIGTWALTKISRSNRTMQLICPRTSTEYFMNSFFPRTNSLWNSLLKYVACTDSLSNFNNVNRI